MVSSESSPTIGADANKGSVHGGQVADKLPTAAVEPGQTPAGTLAEKVPAGFPFDAPSRATVVGVTHKPRNMSRVRTRKGA